MMSRFNLTRRAVLAGAAALLLSSPALAAPNVYQTGEGVAVNGADVVAYFTEGRPVDGNPAFSVQHDGATWQFASAANRDLFAADPARYAPQYGGYCAYAVSYGSTATTVPEAWKIVDDKLYLNYSTGVRTKWEKDIPDYIAKADANWPGVLN